MALSRSADPRQSHNMAKTQERNNQNLSCAESEGHARSSSDEEILFEGRQPREPSANSQSPPIRPRPEHATSTPLQQDSRRFHNRRAAGKWTTKHKKSSHGAAATVDYIANIKHNLEDVEQGDIALNPIRDLGGSDSSQSDVDIPGEEGGNISHCTEIESGSLSDLNITKDKKADVHRILDRRKRKSGVQYLVVDTRAGGVKAKWQPRHMLAKTRRHARMINAFDIDFEGKAGSVGIESADDSFSDSEELETDLQVARADVEEERHLEDRYISRMTDEQIAQTLSKQMELGLDSHEIMLFNGDELDTPPPRDSEVARALHNQSNQKHGFSWSTEDGCNAIEHLEGQNATLKGKSRTLASYESSYGRRGGFLAGDIPPDLSDSELEQSRNISREKDRAKKKLRKQEREELRALGMLGKKKFKRAVTRESHADDMGFDDLKQEIRNFLQSSDQTLPLSPMASHVRKVIHEVCHKLAIKSRSVGSGKDRFPILYKTSRTKAFDERVFASFGRRLLPQHDRRERARVVMAKKTHHQDAKGGFYRDGEVVGALAPELGHENRGRAMLEKMGWSTGSGLGALNNRGISAPVAQVVRTSRAGLG